MSAEDIKVGDHVSLNPSKWTTTTPAGRKKSDRGVVTFVDSNDAKVIWVDAVEHSYDIEALIKVNSGGGKRRNRSKRARRKKISKKRSSRKRTGRRSRRRRRR